MCFLLTATDYSIAGIKRCEFYREGKGDHKLYTRYVEGRKRVKLVGYDLPDPRIVVIEATKPEGSIGNPFIIRIVGANLGAYSPEGTITVSFPGDPVMLMECSANIKGQCQYYPKGINSG